MRLKLVFLFIFAFFLAQSDVFAADLATTGAPGVICDFIALITGRIGRAICIIIIMGMSFLAFQGSLNWKTVLTIMAGFGLMFGAKNFAVMILYSKITNVGGTIGGKTFYRDKVYTPEEVISAACPN